MSTSKSIFSHVLGGAAVLAFVISFGGFTATPAIAACYDVPNGIGGTIQYCDALSPPVPAAPMHFAAIYYDETTLAFGASWGYDSAPAARQAALQACRAHGGRNCQWAVDGQNRCLALAISTNGAWKPAFGNDPESTIAEAVSTCRESGGVNCQVPALAHVCSEG